MKKQLCNHIHLLKKVRSKLKSGNNKPVKPTKHFADDDLLIFNYSQEPDT